MKPSNYTPAMQRELAHYHHALPARLEFDAIARLIEDFDLREWTCLDVGLSNPAMSYALRQLGGDWSTLVKTAAEADRFTAALEAPVAALAADGAFPFNEKSFDLLVLGMGQLTASGDELAVLRECHRILKPTGNLVFSLEHAKPWALANLIRRLSGLSASDGRHGYTEKELFEVIKTGFDVFSIRTYCRFWVSLVRIWEQARQRRQPNRERIARRAGRLYRLAHQLDALLFWTRGYVLLVHGRRHVWRDRNAPVLRDGRRISEAVLSRNP